MKSEYESCLSKKCIEDCLQNYASKYWNNFTWIMARQVVPLSDRSSIWSLLKFETSMDLTRPSFTRSSNSSWVSIINESNDSHFSVMGYLCNTNTQSSSVGKTKKTYSISQEICTRFCCALLCCGYAIVHNEFTWSVYPFSSGLLCWHWGNR